MINTNLLKFPVTYRLISKSYLGCNSKWSQIQMFCKIALINQTWNRWWSKKHQELGSRLNNKGRHLVQLISSTGWYTFAWWLVFTQIIRILRGQYMPTETSISISNCTQWHTACCHDTYSYARDLMEFSHIADLPLRVTTAHTFSKREWLCHVKSWSTRRLCTIKHVFFFSTIWSFFLPAEFQAVAVHSKWRKSQWP